ncbi:hypothetical protein [Paenibacillus cremeus]|uniref:hypothetical protein n=1 Tax=Paenibacillus cremeus TaxID=2163881 RepID=UPI001648679C|nr:hypothetical protein [Paenibacillus cremeus]
MSVTEYVDKRMDQLKQLRLTSIRNEDAFQNSQVWARIDELKKLKEKFSDKEGNWLI